MGPLDHIGVAVSSLEEGLKKYVEGLGFRHVETEEILSEGVRVAMLWAGDTRVELLEPLNEKSPIYRFLQKRGPGVHHLAFRVDSVAEECERLRKTDAKLIEPAPRPGAGGCQVAFIHPQSAGGVLMELVQRPSK